MIISFKVAQHKNIYYLMIHQYILLHDIGRNLLIFYVWYHLLWVSLIKLLFLDVGKLFYCSFNWNGSAAWGVINSVFCGLFAAVGITLNHFAFGSGNTGVFNVVSGWYMHLVYNNTQDAYIIQDLHWILLCFQNQNVLDYW